MKSKELSPEESLAIITQTIQEAKSQFEEDGLVYMLWGGLVAFAAISQFILLKLGYFSINYYPYFFMPLGFIFTWFYYSKKGNRKSNNHLSEIITTSWLAVSFNIMILGFFLNSLLQTNLIPILMILLGIGIIVSSRVTKSQLFLFSGIIINLSGLLAFLVGGFYHPLIMGVAAFVAIFIPGLILVKRAK